MVNDIDEITEKVRGLTLKERKRFASHKSKAIARKKMSEDEAIRYAWLRLGISYPAAQNLHSTVTTRLPVDRQKKRSWLDRWIKEGA